MKALIVVDIQNDFALPSGALSVQDGSKIVPVANRLIISEYFDQIVLTADWHPPTHKSFASNQKDVKPFDTGTLNGVIQTFWPDHCVFGTKGAEFHKSLLQNKANLIIRKGMNREIDSYSGFSDNAGHQTGLRGYLKDNNVEDVYVCGLATDYCVKYTALDAVKFGFNVFVIEDACKATNKKNKKETLKEILNSGVKIISESVIKP